MTKARTINRDDLLKSQDLTSTKKQIIPFIITNNPLNPPIATILSKYRRILEISEELKPITDSKTLVVQKRATNLKKLLTRADINPNKLSKGVHHAEKHAQPVRFYKEQIISPHGKPKKKLRYKAASIAKQKT